MALQPGQTILKGKYRIEELICQGAYTGLYSTPRLGLQPQMALRILQRDFSDAGAALYSEYRQRFETEAQLGSQLKHPNLIRVFGFEQDSDMLVLVMEYASGGSLADHLQNLTQTNRVISIDDCIRVGLDVAEGLAAIHAQDIVHRNLKPSNILFDVQANAKISDLGLAQIPGEPIMRLRLRQTNMPHPGTPAYMSPEQKTISDHLTPSSDVYALGLVLFEMLTGHVHRSVRPGTRAGKLRTDTPAWLDELLVHMLDYDPHQRPWDGAEVAASLRQGQAVRDEARKAELAAQAAQAALTPKPEAAPVVPDAAPAEAPVTPGWLDELMVQTPAGDAEAQPVQVPVLTALAQQAAVAQQTTAVQQVAKPAAESQQYRGSVALPVQPKPPADQTTEAAPLRGRTRQEPRNSAGIAMILAIVLLCCLFIGGAAILITLPKQVAVSILPTQLTPPGTGGTQSTRVDRPTLIPAAAATSTLAQRMTDAAAPSIVTPTLVSEATATAASAGVATAASTEPAPVATKTATTAPRPTRAPAATATSSKAPPATSSAPADLALKLAPDVTLVLVRVKSGEFIMGSSEDDPMAEPSEKPQNKLSLDEFLIGQYDVTNAQFDAFVKATGYTPTAWNRARVEQKMAHPATPISWDDAVAFCKWASDVTGRTVRLPTEAEWEKAARGTDGRIYPWGNDDPSRTRLNYDMSVTDTTPIGVYSPNGDSPWGAADMAGNVWQWTSTLWSDPTDQPYKYPYTPDDGRENQQADAGFRVLRGGSFLNSASYIRSAYRGAADPTSAEIGYGFRVVVAP